MVERAVLGGRFGCGLRVGDAGRAEFHQQVSLRIVPAGQIERRLQLGDQLGRKLFEIALSRNRAGEKVGAHPSGQDDLSIVREL